MLVVYDMCVLNCHCAKQTSKTTTSFLFLSDLQSLLAIVGWQNVVLVDLREGKLLAEHSIPAPPTGPLVVGDFDNDGINDLIVTCKRG